MTDRIDKEKYEEYKRCFQFLCDKFHWSIGFEKTSMDGNQTISPRIKFRKDMGKGWKGYVRLTNSSHFMYSLSIKSICPYKKRGTRFVIFDSVKVINRRQDFHKVNGESIIHMNDLLMNESSVRLDFIQDRFRKCDTIENVVADSASIGEDDPELAKFKLLHNLKYLMTHESNVIFTRSLMNPKGDRIYLEYLSSQIPKFNTLEELRIKMDLNPIETITKEFKIVD